jgi:hypothetical protein
MTEIPDINAADLGAIFDYIAATEDSADLAELLAQDPESFRAFVEQQGLIDDPTAKDLLEALQNRGAPQPGDRMPDGTVYAGTSPETGKAMYTTPKDTALTMKWKQAMEYAAKLDAHGHQDWRMPTSGELSVLFKNRAAIGGFDESGSGPAGWYWSSSQLNDDIAWSQRFSDGGQDFSGKDTDSSLRCVR